MTNKESNYITLTDNVLTQVSGGDYEDLYDIGDGYNKYARFVKTTNSLLPGPRYYVQMKRKLDMISPLFETLDEAIAWFEANAPALYPEYFGTDDVQ